MKLTRNMFSDVKILQFSFVMAFCGESQMRRESEGAKITKQGHERYGEDKILAKLFQSSAKIIDDIELKFVVSLCCIFTLTGC